MRQRGFNPASRSSLLNNRRVSVSLARECNWKRGFSASCVGCLSERHGASRRCRRKRSAASAVPLTGHHFQQEWWRAEKGQARGLPYVTGQLAAESAAPATPTRSVNEEALLASTTSTGRDHARPARRCQTLTVTQTVTPPSLRISSDSSEQQRFPASQAELARPLQPIFRVERLSLRLRSNWTCRHPLLSVGRRSHASERQQNADPKRGPAISRSETRQNGLRVV